MQPHGVSCKERNIPLGAGDENSRQNKTRSGVGLSKPADTMPTHNKGSFVANDKTCGMQTIRLKMVEGKNVTACTPLQTGVKHEYPMSHGTRRQSLVGECERVLLRCGEVYCPLETNNARCIIQVASTRQSSSKGVLTEIGRVDKRM